MSEKKRREWFSLARIKFIWAGIRFYINNLSLKDTTTVNTHKGFLKEISTRQKISSDKDFLLKLVCH